MPSLTTIAAVAENGVIGLEGKMPWHIPEDLKRFKKMTMGHPILMGRKTYESLGKPLPGRDNIVISRELCCEGDDVIIYRSLYDAISSVKHKDAFIIGGGSIYQATMLLIDRLEITRVHDNPKGDTYFPEIREDMWLKVRDEPHENFSFQTYIRK